MAPVNPRVVKAFRAMRDIGIPQAKIKPVLKKLLLAHDKNWDVIEGDNYRVLADAIFLEDEPLHSVSTKNEENGNAEGSEQLPPMKRLRSVEPLDVYTPLAVIHPETSNEKENGSDQCMAIRNAELYVASSALAEANISVSCDKTGFRMPSFDAVVKMVEDRCLRSYKIPDPSFSVQKLLEEVCQCFLELGSETALAKQESVQVLPRNDVLKSDFPLAMVVYNPGVLDKAESETEVASPENLQNTPPCMSLAVVEQNEADPELIRVVHCMCDISKGQESVVIPIEIGNREFLPEPFSYISQNVVFRRAYVDFSLSGMGDDDYYCSACFGDCLISCDLPCVCASETGGEFAYTVEGLVKEKLLDEFISLKRNPQDRSFCKECPFERSKNGEMMEACKGHLVRKFIKECWLKCRCTMKCGNRVVQRGISYKLQVFESQGKGWGVRTLEEIPKGAFVCEYVGEVLTNSELFKRTPNGEGHSYTVLLDADWGSQRILKDEQALCLDGSLFGNVARFINHRCSDANLIEIPIEIENPDHHYYHIACFTTREVKAMEELTWDYGIDFDSVEHPVKAFQCLCGSQFCRNIIA